MYTFTLQPYTTPSSRYRCPACNHRDKTFVRYINTQTGGHLADHVGRCGREDKCGYHYKPRDYFKDNPQASKGAWRPGNGFYPFRKPMGYAKPRRPARQKIIKKENPPEGFHINGEIVNASFKHYDRNNFVQYLISKFGYSGAWHLVGRYRIGTSRHWPGATVFWQLDTEGRARTGKVMLYNAQTGKRVKEPFSHITWVHSLLKEKVHGPWTMDHGQEAFELRQCLFGAHLLTENPQKPVAIVESEKTAIIASYHAPKVIWLAAGSLGNLNVQLCQPLRNRTVTLYPDLGAFDKWAIKAKELQAAIPGSVFMISGLLEQLATEEARNEGWDLGDGL